MIHPLILNFRYLIVYIASWVLIGGIQFALLVLQFKIPVFLSLVDSLVSNCVFGFLGIFLWYAIQNEISGKKNSFNSFIYHLTLLIFFILLWQSMSSGILRGLFSDNQQYIKILDNSLIIRVFYGIILYALISVIYYLIIYYNNLQEKIKDEGNLRNAVKEAQLSALKAQINPHFLFNSLNSVSSLTLSNPQKAHEMIVMLSEFLRYSISHPADQFISLKSELANMNRYLMIEKVRFGKRLNLQFNIPEMDTDILIPAFILQPLFENAVKHGVYNSLEPIEVICEVYLLNESVRIEISNEFSLDSVSKKGTGTGLKNIAERIYLIYKKENLIKIEKTNTNFKVILIFPKSLPK